MAAFNSLFSKKKEESINLFDIYVYLYITKSTEGHMQSACVLLKVITFLYDIILSLYFYT